MSKWPGINDNEWPQEVPCDYFFDNDRNSPEGMSWRGIRAVMVGLCRRVDELEKELGRMRRQVADDSMSAALRNAEHRRGW